MVVFGWLRSRESSRSLRGSTHCLEASPCHKERKEMCMCVWGGRGGEQILVIVHTEHTCVSCSVTFYYYCKCLARDVLNSHKAIEYGNTN